MVMLGSELPDKKNIKTEKDINQPRVIYWVILLRQAKENYVYRGLDLALFVFLHYLGFPLDREAAGHRVAFKHVVKGRKEVR